MRSNNANEYLHQFRRALQSANGEEAWLQWRALEDAGSAEGRLSARDLADLRKLLFRCYQDVHPSSLGKEQLFEHIMYLAKRSAQKAADNDSLGPELVNTVSALLGMCRHREALDVLEQYFLEAQLHQRRVKAPQNADKGKESQHTTAGSTSRSAARILPRSLHVLLLLTIYAHVSLFGHIQGLLPLLRGLPLIARQQVQLATDPWALDKLSFRHRNLTPEQVELQKRNIDRTLQALRTAELAWGLDRPADEIGNDPLARIFASLLSRRDAQSAALVAELCNVLLHATKTGPNAWLSVEGLDPPANHRGQQASTRSAADRHIRPADVTSSLWSVLLRGLLSAQDTQTAGRVWAHLREIGVPPSNHIYNGLLTGYMASGQTKALRATWVALHKDLHSVGGPDVHCYTTMIHGLFKAGNIDEAMSLFEEVRARGANKQDNFTVPAETYNAVIFGLLVRNRLQTALDILEEMIVASEGDALAPRPINTTWNIFLRTYARTGDLAAISSLLAKARATTGFVPDVVSFVTILDGIIRFGSRASSSDPRQERDLVRERVQGILDLMHTCGVKMNTVAWTALIKGVLASGRTEAFTDDEDDVGFVSSHGDSADVAANEWDSESSDALQVKEAQVRAGLSLLSRMIVSGMSPNEVTFTSIIQSAVALQKLYDEMPRQRQASNINRTGHQTDLIETTVGQHLAVIPELHEKQLAINRMRQERPGQAVALALLSQMRSDGTADPTATLAGDSPLARRYHLAPNRKTYNVLLASLLRSTPDIQAGMSDLATDPARVAFTRGLALVDELTLSEGGRGDAHQPFTPLFDAGRIRKGFNPAAAKDLPGAADASFCTILDALLYRYDGLVSMGQRLQQRGITDSQAMQQQVERELKLTCIVLRSILGRIAAAELAQNTRQGAGAQARAPKAQSATLVRLRKRATSLLAA